MNKNYHAVPTQRLSAHVLLACAEPPSLPQVTHIDDPALSVMADFNYIQPPLISQHRSLDEALAEMQLYHLPVLLVTEKAPGHTDNKILGIITSEDILGEKPVKLSQERRIQRSEIETGMLMTPLEKTIMLDIADLVHTKVGHIIQTLRETKQHTLLVLDFASDPVSLRGFFSASLISKQLDRDITLVLSEAQSIAELQHDLSH